MRIGLLIILSFITASFAFAQKTDSVTKAPGNILEAKYNKAIQTADEYFKNKDFANAKTFYENALKLKEDEKYPKEQIVFCDNNLKVQYQRNQEVSDSIAGILFMQRIQDSLKKDSAMIVNKKFSFIGTWKGKIENDNITLMFNADGSFRGIVFDPKPDDVVGIWKLTGDSLYIEADEPNEINKPNYKNNPEKMYLKYKIISADEVLLYFPELKKESAFIRQKQ